MRKKLKNLASLGSILPSAMRQWKVDKKMTVWSLQEKWQTIVGEPLARKTYPSRIQSSILWVAVSSPSWANELQLMQCELLAKIQSEFPQIREIRFQTS